MVGDFIQEVFNPARLAALRRLGLLDTPAEQAFDRLGALAAKILKSPIALVTLMDDTRQFFKSCRGLPEPWSIWRYTPLSHSFCKHLLTTDRPLIIPDARKNPLFAHNLAVRDLKVIAYLGVPLILNTGEVIGSFCVIDHEPRDWTDDDVSTLSVLAASVMTEIELRSEILYKRAALKRTEELNSELSEKATQLEALTADLEAFNRSLFHDLRSPVSSVVAFTQLLRESAAGPMSAESLRFLDRIEMSGQRMERILDGLTTLFGATQTPLRIRNVDLTGMAEQILETLRASAPDREVTIQIERDLQARGDTQLLQVALENLLHNAWKFTSKMTHACIEVGQQPSEDGQVFFVRDNGAGFDPALGRKLFVPFERLHSSRDFTGSGIGLATVKRIIDRHGGRIWAEGAPGKGAIFYFTLNANEPARAEAAEHHSAASV
ncbi:MAG TPA: ATP-binding protein [Verrucomicrobiae bacterium]|nr:ATP-binding protein [Verrucomicrobiae bacterium]